MTKIGVERDRCGLRSGLIAVVADARSTEVEDVEASDAEDVAQIERETDENA